MFTSAHQVFSLTAQSVQILFIRIVAKAPLRGLDHRRPPALVVYGKSLKAHGKALFLTVWNQRYSAFCRSGATWLARGSLYDSQQVGVNTWQRATVPAP